MRTSKTLKIIAIVAGSLIAGMFCMIAFETFAFVGPTANPATGTGAIGSDAANEVSIGTSTPTSGTALLIVGSTSASGTYAEQIKEANGTSIIAVRDDGAVSIGTSTFSPGNTVIGGNLTVGGTLSAPSFSGSSTISAVNVSSGQFGSGTGGGNYQFPANVALGTLNEGVVTSTASTGATTINWATGNEQVVQLQTNTTFTFTNCEDGQTGKLFLYQDGTGSWTVTWPTTGSCAVSWLNGEGTPKLETTANTMFPVTFIFSDNSFVTTTIIGYGQYVSSTPSMYYSN
jgi:hypothetical protein